MGRLYRQEGRVDMNKYLQVIVNAAEAGDKDAASWLAGKGKIVVTKEGGAYYQDFEGDRQGEDATIWRNRVFERDNYRCQRCGTGGKLQAHHIKQWADDVEGRFDLDNGITLCVDCHAERHPKYSNLIKKARYHGGCRQRHKINA